MKITLREVLDSDVAVFWAHMSEQTAQRMAAVTRKYHYDRRLFDAHWVKVCSDSAVTVRTVLADEAVAGHAAVFGPSDEREVTYWIASAYWGRGVASAALRKLIALEPARPLHAHAAADNAGSLRVLEKCGFTITGRGRIFAQARGDEIDELALTLE
ncbi:GNAT family N-acetyltransferase [Streptomyces purpurogeneiscleroticus]|uniref:GNAT family N-acetyltransferase n=1 Tax=Streptomyces purpurogeneiscleroticus TaxID=68259 RepID=UPI001CBBA0E5|nr:GNAT family N-acetyltransferase [Streptomyces purpurogeneiscleroticus]MBZ4018910.1 GNAT family N-acetyltransferase [Streptomyces purpurogeneiscleroticus]